MADWLGNSGSSVESVLQTIKADLENLDAGYPYIEDLMYIHVDIYLAFEEYFATQITNNERTESTGLTDKEKIENHGFDTKVSFRGKQK